MIFLRILLHNCYELYLPISTLFFLLRKPHTQSTILYFYDYSSTATSGNSSGICVVRFLSTLHYPPSKLVELAHLGNVTPDAVGLRRCLDWQSPLIIIYE